MASASTARPRRIRVCTLVDYLTMGGGAERLALLIATRLDPERFDSTLSVSRFPTPPARGLRESDLRGQDLLQQAGTRLLALRRKRKVELAAWVRLAAFLRRERVDVLHTHKFGSNVWGTPVGRLAGVPVVIAHEHTWSYEGQPLRRLLDRHLIARCADRFIAVSREDRRRMSEIEGIDPGRTMFIPNGVLPLPAPSGSDLRAELGLPPQTPLIGTVGMLRAQKAHAVLIEAVASMRTRWPQLHALIVGAGPERGSLERMIDDRNLGEQVHMLGDRADIPDVLHALDVAVCCSDFEGSPLSVMEYMDAGLAIVATAVGGVPDLIEPGVQGLLVPPRDPAALAGAIAELLGDPQRRAEMGERARERRRREFDVDVQVRRLEELYLELLREKAPERLA